MTIIDCHTHILCPAVNDKVGPLMRPDLVPYQRDMTPESKSVDQAQGPVLGPKFNDIATRRAEMSRMRVDKAGVLPAPGQSTIGLPRISSVKSPGCRTIMWPGSLRLFRKGCLAWEHCR